MAASTSLATKALSDGLAIFGFKGSQGGVEDFTLGHDDHVEAWRDLVSTENLSNQSFSSISLNRAAHFLGRRDSEPAISAVAGQQEDGQIAPARPKAALVDQLEVGATADMLAGPESRRHSVVIRC